MTIEHLRRIRYYLNRKRALFRQQRGFHVTDILLIEDNVELGQLVRGFLTQDGFSVCHVTSGEAGLDFLRTSAVRLVLLDIMLPGLDGFSVCATIRERAQIPILILSARSDKSDQLRGLNLGADDYIEKPFDIDILMAKIHTILRRNASDAPLMRVLRDGNLVLDLDANRLTIDDRVTPVTQKELQLLRLFLENPGKALRKEWLFEKVWGSDSFSEMGTLNVHINKLRDKIEPAPNAPVRIVTLWGVGYKYETL